MFDSSEAWEPVENYDLTPYFDIIGHRRLLSTVSTYAWYLRYGIVNGNAPILPKLYLLGKMNDRCAFAIYLLARELDIPGPNRNNNVKHISEISDYIMGIFLKVSQDVKHMGSFIPDYRAIGDVDVFHKKSELDEYNQQLTLLDHEPLYPTEFLDWLKEAQEQGLPLMTLQHPTAYEANTSVDDPCRRYEYVGVMKLKE